MAAATAMGDARACDHRRGHDRGYGRKSLIVICAEMRMTYVYILSFLSLLLIFYNVHYIAFVSYQYADRNKKG